MAQSAPVGSTVQKVGAKIAQVGVENPHVSRIIEGFLTPYRGVTEAATGIKAPERLVSEAPAKNDLLGKIEEVVGRVVGSYPLIALAGAGATGLGAVKGANVGTKIIHEIVTGGLFGAATTEGGALQRTRGAQEAATVFAPFALAGGGRLASALKVGLGSLLVDVAKDTNISASDIQNALLAGVMVGLTKSGSDVLQAESATKEAQKAALEVLGVGEKATAEEIRLAYRNLAREFHPDVGGSTETMAKINKAYEILSGYKAPAISFDPLGQMQVAWSKLKAQFAPKTGGEIVPTTGKVSQIPNELKSLAQDAQNYKSLEDFQLVVSEGNHGSPEEINKLLNNNNLTLSDVYNMRGSVQGKPPFIGMVTADGKVESYNYEQAKRADFNHSMVVSDMKAYDKDSTLRFVRNDNSDTFTLEGNVAIDPTTPESKKQLALFAKEMIDRGADPNMKVKLADQKLPANEAKFQGLVIGKLNDFLSEGQVSQTPESKPTEAITRAPTEDVNIKNVLSRISSFTSAGDFSESELGTSPTSQLGTVDPSTITIRDPIDEAQVAKIVRDIKAGTPVEPIVVEEANGKLTTVDGSQRTAAFQQLNEPAPVVVVKGSVPGLQTIQELFRQENPQPPKLPSAEFDQVGAQQAIRDIEETIIESMLQGDNTAIGRGSKAIDAIVKEAKSAGTELSRSTVGQLREKADYLTSEQQGQITILNPYEQFGAHANAVKTLVDYYRRVTNIHGEEARTVNGMKITEHIPQGKGRQASDELASSLGMSEGELMDKVKELAAKKPKMAPEARANPFLREELKTSFEKAQKQPVPVKPVEKGVETGVPEKASVEEILKRGASFDRYAGGRYFFAMEKYTHKDTTNAQWFAENIPLTRMGNKRGMIGYILNGLGVTDKNLGNVVTVPNALEITGVHDLFGGSGFLTVMTSKLFPSATRDLNEYDPDMVSYYHEIQRDPKRVADWVTAIQDYVKKNPGKVDWKKELKLLRPDFQEDPSYRAAEFIVSYNDDISRGRGVSDSEFKRIITAIYNFSSDLKDVKIVNSDAFAQIDHYIKNGKPTDFLWIDPPYIWSSGYGVGTELEKASGFERILKQLDKLNEKGVRFMFFNNEPESRVSTAEAGEQAKLPGLLKQLDELSKKLTVIRNISPLGAQNREELMITNYLPIEENKAIRPITNLQDVLRYEVSVKGELPPDTKAFVAEASEKTLEKLQEREQILSQREFDLLMKEADKALFTEHGVKTPGEVMKTIEKDLRTATNDAIRDRIMSQAGDVTVFDYARTPEGVFKKIGMEKEFGDLRQAQTDYEKELSASFTKFNGWFHQVKGIKDSRKRIFDYLNGQDVSLSAPEQNVANNIANFLKDLADRQGLPMENRITNYITHIFEPELSKQQIPPEIMAALEFAVPRGVFNPFLEKRLGASGYVKDVWRALESYTMRSLRKLYLDKPIDRFGAYVDYLPQGAQRYTKYFLNSIVGRPDFVEGLLDDTIRAAAKYIPNPDMKRYFSSRPTRNIFGSINMQIYRGALGLNVNSALKNLTQVVNTYSEEGEIATLVGYMSLLNPQRWKEPETQALMSDIVSAEHNLTQFKTFLQKMDKGLFVLFDAAEHINRYSNYFAAKFNAKRKGLSEEKAADYAIKQTRKTQFAYGKIDLPLLMHNPIGKSLIQFSTFPIKQGELIFGRIKNREWAKLFRYIVGSLVLLYYTGDYLGLDWKDVLIRNVFPNMGPLPQAVGSIYTMMTSKIESERNQAAKDLLYFKDLMIPAGVQIKRSLKGYKAAVEGATSPTSNVHYMISTSPVDTARAIIMGTRALKTIPGGTSSKSKSGLPSGSAKMPSGKLPSRKGALP